MTTPQSTSAPIPPRSGRGLLWAGIALAAAAIGIVALQLSLKFVIVPWSYAPILTAIGSLLVLLSLTRRPGVVRIVVLLLLTALAGVEWFAITVGGRLPAYTGPVQAGKKLPPFRTALADGSPLSDADLQDGKRRAMIFFRGRW
jgi:hypothetical protein